MKISILSPDLSDNCLGRAYLLAKILQRHYDVEIIGPMFGKGIWKPVAHDHSMVYKTVEISGKLRPYIQICKLISKIEGDVIYVSKPLFSSYGIGLRGKLFKNKPLILDIDDWQMGFRKDEYRNVFSFRRLKSFASSVFYAYNTGSYWNNLLGEKLVHFADEVTVSNHFLKLKFGGTIVWHGRDTHAFSPEKFDKNTFREKYQIEKTKKVVLFLGTPRKHKGVEDLVAAMDLTNDPDAMLVIAGIDYSDTYSINLIETTKKRLGKDRFFDFGMQPFEKIPEFLALADVVVIPQREQTSTAGQVPAKVFDAMSMAKPILATRVSDLPEILHGCGWIVEPENPEALANKIKYIFDHPDEATQNGLLARKKCIEKYSWDSQEKTLIQIFKKYESLVK